MIKIARFNETQEYSKKFDDNWLDINKTIEKIIDIDKGENYERDELILLPMKDLEEILNKLTK